MTASDRLNAIVAHMHTNVKAFAELCGYERPQAFYDILKGKTKNISPSMCDKILAAFPAINRIWLLTGEGNMLNTEKDVSATSIESADATKRQDGLKYVPLVKIDALAGPISAYYAESEDLSRCELIPSLSPLADLAIPINGDSMEPTFPNGSVAFIARINEASFIPWGHPLVVETENGVFIKNILPDDTDKNFIWAKSINPKYPPMHIPKDAIYRMYRILGITMTYFTM